MVMNKTAKKYGMKSDKMSRVMNKGVIMHCKEFKMNLLTVVGLIFEPSTDIVKPKGSIEAYLSIG